MNHAYEMTELCVLLNDCPEAINVFDPAAFPIVLLYICTLHNRTIIEGVRMKCQCIFRHVLLKKNSMVTSIIHKIRYCSGPAA